MTFDVHIWDTDPLQLAYLAQVYQQAGFQVHCCRTWRQLRLAALANRSIPQALVIGLELPLLRTAKRCSQLHTALPFAALIVVSPFQEPTYGPKMLAAGADDYLMLPLPIPELLARTQARLQRCATILRAQLRPRHKDILDFGSLQLFPSLREAHLAGQHVQLSDIEFKLLHLLAQHANQLLTREQLHHHLWQTSSATHSRRLDNFILGLRKKLPVSAQLSLTTVYGQGYCLKLKV